MCPNEPNVPFQQLVETLLQKAVASGLELPIIVVLLSTSGFVSPVRYQRTADNDWDRTLLVEGNEPKGKFPVNLVFCDANGRSMVVLVNDLNSMPTSIQ
jgi:hypothetical protein